MSLRLNLTISNFIMPEKSFLLEIFTTPIWVITKGEIILTENYSHRLPWALMSIKEDRVDILFCFLNKVSVSHGIEQLFSIVLWDATGCCRQKAFLNSIICHNLSLLLTFAAQSLEEVNNLE